MTFAPDIYAITPNIPLAAEQILGILATHDPATYNNVMRVAQAFCIGSLKMLHEQMEDAKHSASSAQNLSQKSRKKNLPNEEDFQPN